MVPEDFQALSERRAARAQLLAERYPVCGEVLKFYGNLVSFQGDISPRLDGWDSLPGFRTPLVELIRQHGPEPMQVAANALDDENFRDLLTDYWQQRDTSSPASFFARALLQPYAASADPPTATISERNCPHCGHRPQVGVLREQGQGRALSLVCSLCPNEWPFEVGRCTGCGEEAEKSFAYYTTPDFKHLRVQACDTCHTYLQTVDLTADPSAVAEVDELTGLPLDVWAREKGYTKVQPNLAGI